MLRLLLCSIAATALAASPDDDEPKPSTAEAGLFVFQESRTPAEIAKEPPSAFVQKEHTPLFRGNGQDFRLTLDPGAALNEFRLSLDSASDLNLVAPDDALRAQLKLPEDRGLVVTAVKANSPAWLAGVRVSDVLLALEGEPLAKPEDLDEGLKKAGEKQLTLELLRKGAPVKLTVQSQVRVTLGPVEREQSTFLIGVSVVPPGPALRAQLNLPDHQGLVVTSVSEESPAAKNDIKVNDVILTVAGQPQKDQGTLYELVQKNGDKPLAVELLREGARRTVQVTPEKTKPVRLNLSFQRPFEFSNVVLPGVVQYNPLFRSNDQVSNDQVPRWDVQTFHFPKAGSPDASAKRLDEMASEIKELRKAVDDLIKALEERK